MWQMHKCQMIIAPVLFGNFSPQKIQRQFKTKLSKALKIKQLLNFCEKIWRDVVISAVTIVCDSQGSTQHQQKVSICDRKQRKASLNPIPRASHQCEADLKRGLGSPPSDLSLAPQPRPSAPWSLLYSVEQISSQADSWVACEGCSLEKLIILIV